MGRRGRGRRAGRARSGPQAGGRLVIAVGGKGRPRRPEQGSEGPAPSRGPGARYRRGARPGRRGREAPDEIPAVRELLEAFTDLAGAVITAGALHPQGDTAQAITGRHAGYVMTIKAGMPALCKQPEKLPWTAIPATWP